MISLDWRIDQFFPFLQLIYEDGFLDFELFFIWNMLVMAASAFAKMWDSGLNPQGRRH